MPLLRRVRLPRPQRRRLTLHCRFPEPWPGTQGLTRNRTPNLLDHLQIAFPLRLLVSRLDRLNKMRKVRVPLPKSCHQFWNTVDGFGYTNWALFLACFTCFFHTDNHDLPASTRDWGRVVIVAATSGFDDNRRTGAVNLDIFIGIGSGFARVWFSQASLKKASCKYKKYMNIYKKHRERLYIVSRVNF